MTGSCDLKMLLDVRVFQDSRAQFHLVWTAVCFQATMLNAEISVRTRENSMKNLR
jgi:hypothetical protein